MSSNKRGSLIGGSKMRSQLVSRLGSVKYTGMSSSTGNKKAPRRRIKEGSSKYSAVRPTEEPRIWRDGKDVTPLPIDGTQLMDEQTFDKVDDLTWADLEIRAFIPPSEPVKTDDLAPGNVSGIKRAKMKTPGIFKDYLKTMEQPKEDDEKHSRMDSARNHHGLKPDSGEVAMIQKADGSLVSRDDFKTDPFAHLPKDQLQTLLSDAVFTRQGPPINAGDNDDGTQESKSTNESSQDNRASSVPAEGSAAPAHQAPSKAVSGGVGSSSDIQTDVETQTVGVTSVDKGIAAEPMRVSNKGLQTASYGIIDDIHAADAPVSSSSLFISGSSSSISSNIRKNPLSASKCGQIDSLSLMERLVLQNSLREKQRQYRTHWDPQIEGILNRDTESVPDSSAATLDRHTDSHSGRADMDSADLDNMSADDLSSRGLSGIDDDARGVALIATDEAAQIRADGIPQLTELWQFDLWRYQRSKEHTRVTVTGLQFNPLSTDLLAACHGNVGVGGASQSGSLSSTGLATDDGGCVALWTLKNQAVPDRVFDLNSGVCTMDWCPSNPALLAVGTADGHVSVLDVRVSGDGVACAISAQSSLADPKCRKHSRQVWQVLWQRPHLRGGVTAVGGSSASGMSGGIIGGGASGAGSVRGLPNLYSVSGDGSVKEWSLRKGFIGADVMKLRDDAPMCVDGFLSAAGGGGNAYLIGTETGKLHRCSVSYSEQVLATFPGHSGPVYKVVQNPFDSAVFATCSADWTVKLWHLSEAQRHRIDLTPGTESVLDLQWSRFDSCVLASVSDSRVQVWDINRNKKDPVINDHTLDTGPTCVCFAPDSPALVVGDQKGKVTVFRITDMQTSMRSVGSMFAQQQKLASAIAPDL